MTVTADILSLCALYGIPDAAEVQRLFDRQNDAIAADVVSRPDWYTARFVDLAATLNPDDAALLLAFWEIMREDILTGESNPDGDALLDELTRRGVHDWRPILFDSYPNSAADAAEFNALLQRSRGWPGWRTP